MSIRKFAVNRIALTAEQCRGARAMLGWSQIELARAANVSRQTIADFERGAHVPIGNNLASIVAALEEAGIELVADDEKKGAGIRFRRTAASRRE
ncbi:helix-turn-helix domain-containing protein [Ciceribacter sp. RN22]|nr:helix-turn-helix transcriptional regulator [Ciceribacter sp. RN22]MCO6181127.1 helix-turn-helix domain-containing protein [Ciceribacter sp. RN22]